MIQDIFRFWAGSAVSGFQLACIVYCALVWSRGVFGRETLHVRLCAALVAGFWIPCAVFVALIPFGLFDRLWAPALLAGLSGGVYACYGKGYSVRADIREIGSALRETWRQLTPYVRWLTGAVGVVFAVRFCRGMIAPPLAWDALTYHLLKAGRWVQSGGWVWDNAPDAWQFYEWFPPLGDVYWAWAMLGTHTDAWLTVAGALIWVAIGPAVYSAARSLGASTTSAWLAMLAALSVPACLALLTASYVDNTGYALIMLGVALVLPSAGNRNTCRMAVGCVAFALAVGIKITFLPFVLAGGFLLLVQSIREKQYRPLAVCLPFITVALFWQIFLVYHGKTPFYPAPFSIAGIMIDSGVPEFNAFISQNVSDIPYAWEMPISFGKFLMDSESYTPSHLNFTILFPLLLIVGLIAFVAFIRQNINYTGLAISLMFLAGLSIFVHFWLPTTMFYRLIWSNNMGRFFLPLYAILPLMIVSTSSGRFITVLLFIIILVNCGASWPVGWISLDWTAVLLISGGFAFVLLVTWIAGNTVKRRLWVPALVVTYLLFSAIWINYRASKRYEYYDHRISAYDVLPKGMRFPGSAVKYLDQDKPLNINFTGKYQDISYRWFRYIFLGSRLQNKVVYIPSTESGQTWSGITENTPEPAYNFDKWYQRVGEARIDYIFCIKKFPVELQWMAEHPDKFTYVMESGVDYSHLFRVK